jgi:hypothetical protein
MTSGARNTAHPRQIYFGRDAIERLSAITGNSINNDRLAELEEAGGTYAAAKSARNRLPPSRIEERLQRLKKSYDKVADIVGANLPIEVEAFLGLGFSEDVKRHQRSIEIAINTVKVGKSGNRTDYALLFLINKLSEIYNNMMGRTDRLVKSKSTFLAICLATLGVKISQSQLSRRYRESRDENIRIIQAR